MVLTRRILLITVQFQRQNKGGVFMNSKKIWGTQQVSVLIVMGLCSVMVSSVYARSITIRSMDRFYDVTNRYAFSVLYFYKPAVSMHSMHDNVNKHVALDQRQKRLRAIEKTKLMLQNMSRLHQYQDARLMIIMVPLQKGNLNVLAQRYNLTADDTFMISYKGKIDPKICLMGPVVRADIEHFLEDKMGGYIHSRVHQAQEDRKVKDQARRYAYSYWGPASGWGWPCGGYIGGYYGMGNPMWRWGWGYSSCF
jgi:hypothetical protein